MNMDIKLFCPAKINLFLEVLDKRPDLYHNLDTVMMSVNLCDTVYVKVEENGSAENRISLKCDKAEKGVPEDSRNIAYKAAENFARHFEITGYDIYIEIEKVIPIAAGLAGGSADGAGVLLALENLFNLQNRRSELLEIGAKLGADVPFCMTCGCAHASGIGDIMVKLPAIEPVWSFVVAKAGEGVSTALAYSEMDSRKGEKRSSEAMRAHLEKGDVAAVCACLYNAFEEVVAPRREAVGRAKKIMQEEGCLGTLMSGSGPSVFGIFAEQDVAEHTRELLEKEGYEAFVCYSVV